MGFMVERAPFGRRGLMGALACCGATLGFLIGSAVAVTITAMMTTETLNTWGWRIPFLLGIVGGIVGVILRRSLGHVAPMERDERTSMLETLRNHWQLVVRAAQLSVFNAVMFLVMFVYMASWLQTADGVSPAHTLEINTIAMMVLRPRHLAPASL